MCIICTELDKNKLSPWEAKRNLTEMVDKIGYEHAREVENKISELIYQEIDFNYGDTLYDDQTFCQFCQDFDCDCTWGDDSNLER